MNEWQPVSLAEICDDVSYGYTASAKDEPVGPKFLRITDIRSYFVDWETVPYCKIPKTKYEKYKLKAGDICIARTGATTGISTVIKEGLNAVFASYLVRFQVNRKIADPFFVGFVLKSDLYKHYIESIIGGSAQPNANATQLGDFEFTLPPLPTQQRIAQILGRLDDKIELNRRINRTLEAMAQALYKHHFVDFGPYQHGEFVDSELGPIPKGWGVVPLKQMVGIDKKTIKPPDFPDEIFNHYSIPAHDNLRPVHDLGKDVKSSKYLITSDRILVSKLNPRFYRIWTIYYQDDFRSFSSTEFINYLCKLPDTWAFMNCHLRSGQFITKFRSRVTGTTGSRQRVKPQDTLKFQVIKPPKEILEKFEKTVSPYFARIQHNIDENRKLAETRDYLLPRLLSGEVGV